MIRNLAWIYAGLFFFVVLIGYIPGLNWNGYLLGIFDIDPFDDVLHLVSAIWAVFAAWHSLRYSLFYFKAFGILYCLDGIIGLIFGNGYLDLAIFKYGVEYLDIGTKIALNLPHIFIGGIAIYIGFILSKKYK
ncbi:hypothetical protein COU54_01145 [Candidatus Pacearchaeota archaeon CG10_big_fil_rev_8_21_14_0_10_31_24]|nr:MAG: hypothetical protein COU54_01145 [Candidatus Pacearchaeota archaeon CG10_big_fil_rev_8_21_14_0_10_31_24]